MLLLYIPYILRGIYFLIIIIGLFAYRKLLIDADKIYFYVIFQTEYLMYLFSLMIATHRQTINQFDEFVPLVYAKKKYFYTKTSWNISDYFELYQSLLEDFHYTERYIKNVLFDPEPTRLVVWYYQFIMIMRPWLWVIWLTLGIMTCWITFLIVPRPR